MSFYGTTFYQLVNNFGSFIFQNSNGITFPDSSNIFTDKEIFAAEGRAAELSIDAGNRWISMTRPDVDSVIIWHNRPNGSAQSGTLVSDNYKLKPEYAMHVEYSSDLEEDPDTGFTSTFKGVDREKIIRLNEGSYLKFYSAKYDEAGHVYQDTEPLFFQLPITEVSSEIEGLIQRANILEGEITSASDGLPKKEIDWNKPEAGLKERISTAENDIVNNKEELERIIAEVDAKQDEQHDQQSLDIGDVQAELYPTYFEGYGAKYKTTTSWYPTDTNDIGTRKEYYSLAHAIGNMEDIQDWCLDGNRYGTISQAIEKIVGINNTQSGKIEDLEQLANSALGSTEDNRSFINTIALKAFDISNIVDITANWPEISLVKQIANNDRDISNIIGSTLDNPALGNIEGGTPVPTLWSLRKYCGELDTALKKEASENRPQAIFNLQKNIAGTEDGSIPEDGTLSGLQDILKGIIDNNGSLVLKENTSLTDLESKINQIAGPGYNWEDDLTLMSLNTKFNGYVPFGSASDSASSNSLFGFYKLIGGTPEDSLDNTLTLNSLKNGIEDLSTEITSTAIDISESLAGTIEDKYEDINIQEGKFPNIYRLYNKIESMQQTIDSLEERIATLEGATTT